MTTNLDEKRRKRREYYLRNLEEERQRAREYARRRREEESPQEAELRRRRHREAASRYRDQNRIQLRIHEWQRRVRKKRQKEWEADEAEYQALMAAQD
ncbi:hypothetical protein CVT24_006580 [Panaeolus cyanescens]|uniref:Uncharacterized protein n=1 Tax=Panaeolus cyanescens TaxID=181874 RepID=A0A409WC94_9AGAR|nr:hypothetical protein CVT24_006580 [Panaeolus cyanescens]